MLKIYFLCNMNLQVLGVKLHVANLLDHHLLHLVAVLLGLLPAALHRRVVADQPLLQVADRLDGLLLALVTDFPGLLLAVLGVAVLLGLLRASLLLQLTDLLGLKVAVLLLHREGEDVGELLTISVNISLTHLHLDLSWDVVAVLLRCSCAHNLLLPIPIILGALLPLAVELHGVGAGHIVDHLLLHVAVRGLHVAALVIILGGRVYLVGGVAHAVLPCEAPLHLVGLLQGLVVDGLNQVTHQLIHIEADTFNIGLYHSSTVLVLLGHAVFLILGPASLLSVWLALVLEHHLLHLVAVGVLVDTIAPYIGLAYVRIVILNRGRGRVLLWRWGARVPRGWSRVLRRWCGVYRSLCGIYRSWCRVDRSLGRILRSWCRVLRIGSRDNRRHKAHSEKENFGLRHLE